VLYLGRLARLDLGTSAHFGSPVAEEIGSRLPSGNPLYATTIREG
jgi:ABC-type dipeptide/oligopeptide/nickel transport system permease component